MGGLILEIERGHTFLQEIKINFNRFFCCFFCLYL